MLLMAAQLREQQLVLEQGDKPLQVHHAGRSFHMDGLSPLLILAALALGRFRTLFFQPSTLQATWSLG